MKPGTRHAPSLIGMALALLLVLYVASPPFVFYAIEALSLQGRLGPAFIIAYKPLEILYKHCPPYRRYIETSYDHLSR